MIEGLAPESLTKTALRNAHTDAELAEFAGERTEHGPWSHTDLLLADVHDAIERLRFAMGDGKGAKPQPYPRPGVGPPGGKRGRMSRDDMEMYEAIMFGE